MSDHYVGLNRGQNGLSDDQYVIGTSTGGTDVEVRIADGAGLSRFDVVLILQAMTRRVEMGGLQDILTSGKV